MNKVSKQIKSLGLVLKASAVYAHVFAKIAFLQQNLLKGYST